MTLAIPDPVERSFWSDQALSHHEREVVKEATPWIEKALNASGRPIGFLTLTCRQAKVSETGGLVHLTAELLSRALEVYLRRIDTIVFKNAARRFEKTFERLVAIEGGGTTGKPIHVHMLVVVPPAEYIEPQALISKLMTTWRSSPWGMRDKQEKHDVDWRPVHDLNGIIQYVLKTGIDSVDLRNSKHCFVASGLYGTAGA